MSVEINPKKSLFGKTTYFHEQNAIKIATDDIASSTIDICRECTAEIFPLRVMPSYGTEEQKISRGEKFLARAEKTLSEIGV